MVFRKPYAFLIKNFKKIHIVMLLAWAFIYYKVFLVKDFVKEFISLGTYNSTLENITSKINLLFYITVIFMIIVSTALLILLKHKKKPWKLYLILIGEYVFMMVAVVSLSSFFKSYDPITPVSSVFLNRDLLNIASWIQYGVLVILILRITGLDLKKFGFNNDKEFLELNSSDREEFEINIEFDKHSISRKYNQLKRNINYFYQEHKFIIRVISIILVVLLVGYSYYFFAIKHKSYQEGDTFTSGRYSIVVDSAYVTNKNTSGEIIEKKSKFVIVKVKIRNNESSSVQVDFSRYHLMNSSYDIINTLYYDEYFSDVGNLISKDNLLNGNQTKSFTLIYKVPNELKNNRFALYFQEYMGRNETYLRKIKLKINDVSKITNNNYKAGDKVVFDILNSKTDVTFDNVSFESSTTYNKYECNNGEECEIRTENLNSQPGKKIIKIAFSSSDFEGKEFIDFSCKYGRIKYVDSSGNIQYYNVVNMLNTEYEGKEIFIEVTDQILESKDIYIEYIVRQKKYTIKIK